MKTYVLYHSKCYDGFGAAYSAWKKLGDTAEYIAVSYNYPLPAMDTNSMVYIVDFSYDRETMMGLCDRMNLVTVLDHHKTAEATFLDLEHPRLMAKFDMSKSGARMTWEHFHKDPVPQLILHIEDRDLWLFKMDRSKEIHKALVSYPMDFELWDKFDVEQLKVEGVALERMYNQLVCNVCEGAWVGRIGADDVPMVNTSIAWSEVGQEMLKRYPAYKYVASFTDFEKEVMWSLRSREDFDCSDVAKTYGGGGHKQAAGFKQRKPVDGTMWEFETRK